MYHFLNLKSQLVLWVGSQMYKTMHPLTVLALNVYRVKVFS